MTARIPWNTGYRGIFSIPNTAMKNAIPPSTIHSLLINLYWHGTNFGSTLKSWLMWAKVIWCTVHMRVKGNKQTNKQTNKQIWANKYNFHSCMCHHHITINSIHTLYIHGAVLVVKSYWGIYPYLNGITLLFWYTTRLITWCHQSPY